MSFISLGRGMRVLQAVLNLGKVTWKLYSCLRGEAMYVCTPAPAAPGEGRVSSPDTARCCGEHSPRTPTALEQRASAAASGCRNLSHSFFPQLSFQHCPVLLRIGGVDPMNPLAQPKERVGRTRPSFQGNGSCARYYDAEGAWWQPQGTVHR